MTTAVSAHLVVLANENGGGFDVQPGQQQAGGTVEEEDRGMTLQTHLQIQITSAGLRQSCSTQTHTVVPAFTG